MTAPIDAAYAIFCGALAEALVDAGFIAAVEGLEIDPPGPCHPSGDETSVQTAAQLFALDIQIVRPLLGSGTPRYLLDFGYRLELAAFGPAPDGGPDDKARMKAAMDAIAPVADADPTLTQTCDRVSLVGAEDDDLPPNGVKTALTFNIRLRAGDPLGRTAP